MRNYQNKPETAVDDICNNSDSEVGFIVEWWIHVWKAITDN